MTDLELIDQNALMHWIAPDGLMALRPDDFIPGKSPNAPMTVPEENGATFRCRYEFLMRQAGHTTHFTQILDVLLYRLSDGEGGFYRTPGWVEEPITHDCVSALASACCVFGRKDLAESIYNEYGSLWRTLRYCVGKSPTHCKRRLRIYADAGFLAFCAGKRILNPFHRAFFLGGLEIGAKQATLGDSNGCLLLWDKFQAVRKQFDLEPRAANAHNAFLFRIDPLSAFAKYFQRPDHPINRVARVLWGSGAST